MLSAYGIATCTNRNLQKIWEADYGVAKILVARVSLWRTSVVITGRNSVWWCTPRSTQRWQYTDDTDITDKCREMEQEGIHCTQCKKAPLGWSAPTEVWQQLFSFLP